MFKCRYCYFTAENFEELKNHSLNLHGYYPEAQKRRVYTTKFNPSSSSSPPLRKACKHQRKSKNHGRFDSTTLSVRIPLELREEFCRKIGDRTIQDVLEELIRRYIIE
jgi:hypothetical protein